MEGRAGMAAVADPDGLLDLDGLATGIRRALPSYAQPLFLRKVKHLDMTGERGTTGEWPGGAE